jgi:glycosyltransferase involved in cell wall biosynthesis
MNFNPCIIIPVYNHGQLLKKSINAISACNLPVIIIDDGSDQQTKDALLEITSQNITILTLPKNEGKGRAVLAGFHHAAKAGFSHALQIDADCQHEPKDIPVFLAKAKEHPECLINGEPIYDASVPKARLYGRNITNFWVKIETLCCNINDAMCGFRVYPMAQVLKLLQKKPNISKRMGFDIDIIVRLYWMGTKIINQPTNVIYPADGSSNFKMLRDNVTISWLHTRLFFGMVGWLFKKKHVR